MAKAKKKTKEQRAKCTMRTSTFTLSYPHLDKPQAPKPGDKEKFSMQALFPKKESMLGWTIPDTKGGKVLRRKLKSIINNALVAEFGADESEWPEDLEKPIKDGDGKKYKGKEGCAGNYVVKFTSHAENRPQLFDEQMNTIEDAAEIRKTFYAGCKCQAVVFAYVWYYPDRNNPMKIGVGIIVDSIQKQEDGKKFSSRRDGSEVFSPLEAGDEDDHEDSDSDDDDSQEVSFY
jgi:hypothetical protein